MSIAIEPVRQSKLWHPPSAYAPASTQVSTGFDLVPTHENPGQGASLSDTASAEQATMRRDIELRVRQLQRMFLEETGSLPSKVSLEALWRFMGRFQWVTQPSLSIDVQGNFAATWRKPQGSLALRLLNTGEIHYSILPAGNAQAWGTASLTSLFQANPAARALAG